MLHGLSKDAGKHTCATIFNLFLRLLPRLQLPERGSKEDTELRSKLSLDKHIDDTKFILLWFSKVILLSIVRTELTSSTARSPPAGLTTSEYDFLTLNGKPDAWDPTSHEGLNLIDTKVTILSFLASGAFIDEERFLTALFAAADPNSRISSIAEDILKRITVSLEDTALIKNLFGIYTISKPALKIRILIFLSKSVVATTFPHQIITIVQESMLSENTNSPPVKGLEASKLRNALFSFMNWVARVGSESDLQKVAPVLISFLRSFIEEQGWPVPNGRSVDEVSLRALAYETLGAIAKAVPITVLEPELSLVQWLFRSLTEERSTGTIIISIEGALASLLNAFAQPLDPKLKEGLRSLLLKYMTQEEGGDIVRSARFSTLRWANRCLEYSDVVGRWIDILALGSRTDERREVVEEGNKGLVSRVLKAMIGYHTNMLQDPHWYRLVNSLSNSPSFSLPDWTQLVKNFFTDQDLLGKPGAASGTSSGMEIDSVSVFGKFSGTNINAFTHAVGYCHRMLLLSALENPKLQISGDADWERQLDVLCRTDKRSRKSVRLYMNNADKDALIIFFSAAFEGMLWKDGNELQLQDCGKSFVELGSLTPRRSLEALASRANELLRTIGSNNYTTRCFAAQAFGMLAPHPMNEGKYLVESIRLLLESAKSWDAAIGIEANRVHGSILALGYLLSRIVYYGRLGDIEESLLQNSTLQILDILIRAKDANKGAALNALGQICASGLLTDARIKGSPYSIDGIIKALASEAKMGNEKAIAALGRLAMTFDGDGGAADGHLTTVLTNLYGLYELRQAEVHIATGEALACAAACWQSDSLLLSLDVDAQYDGRKKRSSTLTKMMDKMLTDCKSTKPPLKKASAIWLFCLIQYCGHLEEIQSRLRECQAAFMGLLSARDDLVQEAASRGLCLVYEQGDKDLKDRLAKDLVTSFTGTSAQLKVDEDTELFEPGALPTGDGQSVISYKDIMSLAAEVGDQSLVYKFMHLASNAATWSTRAAFGRFGLSSILSESTVDPKLYPKLYRYRFDPNPNVQRSMNDIWSSLVTNPTAIINEHFKAIMEDLLKNILGREWRTRQASCAAIGDLIQGRPFEMYKGYLSQVWGVAFQVLDDIKGSVRKAAESLCKVLAGVLVRMLEEGTSSKNAQTMLKEVMPFLFSTRGLESSAPDVQRFAYDTLLKLVKSGGKSLLPFIPGIVEQILGLLSVLEPDLINFIHINAAKFETTEEEIDEARSRIVSHSPMMEAIERCLGLMDESVMKSLVPSLENVIKTSVGVPSKVGCSGVLVSLATRHSFLFRPHADIFLKDIEKAVLDRNSTVSAAYARAAGYVSRLASDEQLLKLLTYSKNLYFSAEDENRRQISADILYAVSKFATDRFHSLASEFLPFVFLAKHDFDEHVKDQFGKAWDENVGGSRTVLLYMKEITTISSECLDSPKWAIKHTAALAIAEAVSSPGTDISLTNAEAIWPALEKALALKAFDGKEKVLEAYVEFIKSAKELWQKDPSIAAQMKKIAVREAKRNNDAYRPHAFISLGEFAEARTDIDIFDEILQIVTPRLEELVGEDSMDIAGEKVSTSADATIITAGITAVFRAINVVHATPSPFTRLPPLLALLQAIYRSPKSTNTTRIAVYEHMAALFSSLPESACAQGDNYYSLAYSLFSLLELYSNTGSETMRMKRALAVEALVLAMARDVFGTDHIARNDYEKRVMEEIKEAKKNERSAGVRNVLEKAEKGLLCE
jgi:proteasome component ECM29